MTAGGTYPLGGGGSCAEREDVARGGAARAGGGVVAVVGGAGRRLRGGAVVGSVFVAAGTFPSAVATCRRGHPSCLHRRLLAGTSLGRRCRGCRRRRGGIVGVVGVGAAAATVQAECTCFMSDDSLSGDEEPLLPAAPVDDADANILQLVDAVQLPLDVRAEDGQFLGNQRRRRRRDEPKFALIEMQEQDPAQCYEGGADDMPEACSATRRCAAHGGVLCRTWLIRGPVRGWSDDGWRLSVITNVRACATMAPHEVYARSMKWLVPATYLDMEDAYNSVRFVAAARTRANLLWDTTSPNSSYRGLAEGQVLADEDVAQILRHAATTMQGAANRLHAGHVALVRRQCAIDDHVSKQHLRALLRQRSVRAVMDYRNKGAVSMKERWVALLRDVGAGVVARMRRTLELEKPDRHGPAGKRSSRIRISRGFSQMRLLPTAEQLRETRRVAFDAENRVPHFFLTRRAGGEIVRWNYIRGSGSAGIRRYRSTADEQVKRLRGFNNKYWEQASGEAQAEDDSDVSDDEDGGIFFGNDNAETEGCYAPMERDPRKVLELIAKSHSYLEDDDGNGELRILAVAFDPVTSVQRAIDTSANPRLCCTAESLSTAAVLTLAADGGTVKGKAVTAYAVAVSWTDLDNGRTDLIPLMYSLSGEKSVDQQVARYLRGMLQEINAASFTVAVVPAVPGSGGGGQAGLSCRSPGGPSQAAAARVLLQMRDEIQVCGMFASDVVLRVVTSGGCSCVWCVLYRRCLHDGRRSIGINPRVECV